MSTLLSRQEEGMPYYFDLALLWLYAGFSLGQEIALSSEM